MQVAPLSCNLARMSACGRIRPALFGAAWLLCSGCGGEPFHSPEHLSNQPDAAVDSSADSASDDSGYVGDVGDSGGSGDGGDNGDCADSDVASCYEGPAGTEGKGQCRAGQRTCVNGSWSACEGQVLPELEKCDGLDNDCDGVADAFEQECYEGPSGTLGVGPCRAGRTICENGKWSQCVGQVVPVAEVCGDWIDDNCNGSDEACLCGQERQEVLFPASDCNLQCQSSVADSDCDGLEDGGDPWAGTCNGLVLADDFKGCSWDGWAADGSPPMTCDCERAVLPAGAWSTKAVGGVASADYLVEARFILKQALSSYGAIEFWAAREGTDARACNLISSGASRRIEAECKTSNAASKQPKSIDLPMDSGSAFVLQSYEIDNLHTCRLLDPTGGTVLAEVSAGPCTLTKPGRVMVYSRGQPVMVDYLRVYRAP